jgi:hypothetical protein
VGSTFNRWESDVSILRKSVDNQPLYKIRPGQIGERIKLFPGMVFPGEVELLNIPEPHKHCFNSEVGIVFGSSIWWIYDPKQRLMATHTRIAGLLCSCGSVLMLDNPDEKNGIYQTSR